MKPGQRIKSAREIKETRDDGDVVVSKGIDGTVLKLIGEKVEIEFDGPYLLRKPGKSEVMEGKVKVTFDVIRSRNYLG
jgi:hypothetical protein